MHELQVVDSGASWYPDDFTELLSVPCRCGTHLYEDANHTEICRMFIYAAMGKLNVIIWTVTNQTSSWNLSLSESFKCCLQMLYTIKYLQHPDYFNVFRYVQFCSIVSVPKTRHVHFPSANYGYTVDYRPDWVEQIINTANWRWSFCQRTKKILQLVIIRTD